MGKTTVARGLAMSKPTRYVHLSFGQLLIAAVTQLTGREPSEPELRRTPRTFITGQVLAAATAQLRSVSDDADGKIVVVDSHAVSQDWHGYYATPDGASYFQHVRYGAVVQLYAPAAVILARTEANRRGRLAATAADLETHFVLQASVSTTYGSLSECPVLFVEASEPAEHVTRKVDRLLMEVSET